LKIVNVISPSVRSIKKYSNKKKAVLLCNRHYLYLSLFIIKCIHMKGFLFFLLMSSIAASAQVTISSPYEYGQSQVVVDINYTTITVSDSSVLEVSYNGEKYVKVISAKGMPAVLTQGYSFKFQRVSNRKFRVVVYQKGKDVIYSNEIEIYYKAQLQYSEGGLPSVTNVKASLIEKNGARYLHVTWTPVPGALAYRLFTQDGGSMIWEASEGDRGYLYTTSYDFPVTRTTEYTYVIGVGAIEGPADNTDVSKLVNKAKVTVPGLY
jgi:hypothetical protein